jgi:Protein RETICULATA-related
MRAYVRVQSMTLCSSCTHLQVRMCGLSLSTICAYRPCIAVYSDTDACMQDQHCSASIITATHYTVVHFTLLCACIPGYTVGVAGYGLTSTMQFIRKKLNPDQRQTTEEAPILRSSVAIGLFLAVSSNLR